jgi:hypothetical protein
MPAISGQPPIRIEKNGYQTVNGTGPPGPSIHDHGRAAAVRASPDFYQSPSNTGIHSAGTADRLRIGQSD